MVNNANWLLPEGVEEILPDEALKLELLRRAILDDFAARDFKLVMPPLMEFVDALLTGTGEELDTQTYKFMDQHTHRMLGIRADITPQVARIDSHYLADHEINRLCYAGTVLRTQPARMGEQRELFQIGAELFGVADESADIEIIEAMLATLSLASLSEITLSLGHVGVYRALCQAQEIAPMVEQQLRQVMFRKSTPDLASMADQIDVAPFQSLLKMAGSDEVLDAAGSQFQQHSDVQIALSQLENVVQHVQSHHSLNLHIDLADVTGYRYHTGITYNAFIAGRGRSVAQGGRYDRIGEQFGRPRPATGFSTDLKTLIKFN